jgi:methenyltetrahydrofolate cyclohydrolase
VGGGVSEVVSDLPVGEYLRRLASTAAVPGGGSAADLAAALGCALISMVAKLSVKRAKDPEAARTLEALVPEADHLMERLLTLSQEDIVAYQAVLATRRARPDALEARAQASHRAAEVPLEAAQAAWRGIELYRRLRPLAWSMTLSDAEAAALLLHAGFRAALANVEVNLPDLQGEAKDTIERAYTELRRAAERADPTDQSDRVVQ